MRVAAILSGLSLSLVASAALACPTSDRCDDRYGPPPAYEPGYSGPGYDQGYGPSDEADRYEDAYRDGYDAGYDDGLAAADDGYGEPDAPGVWEDERGTYNHGYRGQPCGCAPPPCGCQAAGLTLSSSFFDGQGGVGPIPDGGYYSGGGYYIAQGGGAAYAFSRASARATANVSVRYHGGYSHGGHMGGGKRW